MPRPYQFHDYIDQLEVVNFWKYCVLMNYYDLRFTYGNINQSGGNKYRFEVYGVMNQLQPFFPIREYLIYSQEKVQNPHEWTVRIPEIYPQANWQAGPLYDGIQNIYPGQGYGEPSLAGVGKAIGVGELDFNQITKDLRIRNLEYLQINISDIINEYTRQYYGRYGEFPGLIIEGSGDDDAQYYFIPISPSSYKIKLSSPTGESVVTSIPGPLLNANIAQLTAGPSFDPNLGLPAGNTDLVITLNQQNPNGSAGGIGSYVNMPLLYNKPWDADTKSRLTNLGLTYTEQQVYSQYSRGKVISTAPGFGQIVRRGSNVKVRIGV